MSVGQMSETVPVFGCRLGAEAGQRFKNVLKCDDRFVQAQSLIDAGSEANQDAGQPEQITMFRKTFGQRAIQPVFERAPAVRMGRRDTVGVLTEPDELVGVEAVPIPVHNQFLAGQEQTSIANVPTAAELLAWHSVGVQDATGDVGVERSQVWYSAV